VLVISDGGVPQSLVSSLVVGNPVGLYRVQMMHAFAGPEVLQDLGLTAGLPSARTAWLLWLGWLGIPALLSGILLSRRKIA
jgi:hypothetical protein